MMKFSEKEIVDLLKAWLAISIAFGILLGRESFFTSFLVAALTVGVGFILHELAHKYLAQRYRKAAEFRSFDFMLLLAIGMAFLGFVIAAPGAVIIRGRVTREENGRISAAGIAASLTAAFLFLIIGLFSSEGLVSQISYYGLLINSWLAIFNLIPFGMFDGSKVFRWNRLIYFSMVVTGLLFLYLSWII